MIVKIDATPPRMAVSERRRSAPYLGASAKISRAGGAPAEFSQPDMVGIGGGNSVTYIEHSRAPDGASGYHVYRADIDGSEAVAITQDGQDQEAIEAVESDCEYVRFVEVKSVDPDA